MVPIYQNKWLKCSVKKCWILKYYLDTKKRFELLTTIELCLIIFLPDGPLAPNIIRFPLPVLEIRIRHSIK